MAAIYLYSQYLKLRFIKYYMTSPTRKLVSRVYSTTKGGSVLAL